MGGKYHKMLSYCVYRLLDIFCVKDKNINILIFILKMFTHKQIVSAIYWLTFLPSRRDIAKQNCGKPLIKIYHELV